MRGKKMRISIVLVCLAIWVTAAHAQTLKPGDSLNITVLQDPKLDRTVVVDPSGEIAFPLAGHVRARGLTPQALEKILIARLKDNYKDDHLDGTVAIANSPQDIPEQDLKPQISTTWELIRPGSSLTPQPPTHMHATY